MLSSLIRKLLRGQILREWFVEFLQSCTVGLDAYIVDVGLFNPLAYSLLIDPPGDKPFTAKIVSVIVSVIFVWIANRLWTFKKRRSKNKGQEFTMFALVNPGGLLITLGCLGLSRYVLHLATQFVDSVSGNIVGPVFGTAFRYVMYHYFVFSPASRCEEVASCGKKTADA